MKFDTNRLYNSEYKKFTELSLKETPLTNIGNITFTSTSSGLTYTVTDNTGEEGLLQLLHPVVEGYMITGADWNNLELDTLMELPLTSSGNYTLLSDKAVIVSLTYTATAITVTNASTGKQIIYDASVGTDRYTYEGVTKYFSIEGGYVNATGFKFWTQWNGGVVTNWAASAGTYQKVKDVFANHIEDDTAHGLGDHLIDYVRQPGYINPTGGTSTAYTGSTTPPLSAYTEGIGITIVPHVDCGNSPTFNWDGKGAIALLKQDGTSYEAGEILAGKPYSFRKVGASFLADSSGNIKITGQTEDVCELAGATNRFDPVYLVESDTLTLIQNSVSVPTYSECVAYSKDGKYLAVGHNGSPYVSIYKRNIDTYTKLPNPTVIPTGNVNGVSFTSDGLYLATTHLNSPYISIYKRNGDVFTKLSNPDVIPTSNSTGCAFSPDGTYLVVTNSTDPRIIVYKRNGDTFTKLANPSSQPSSFCYTPTFSLDGIYLSIASTSTTPIHVYKRNGDVFTKLSDPYPLPTNGSYAAALSPDGVYLAVTGINTIPPYITIYKRSGDSFSKLSTPSSQPPTHANAVAFSPNGLYLAIGQENSPYIIVYKRNGDVFTQLSAPDIAGVTDGTTGIAFSPDNLTIATTSFGYPYLAFHKRYNKAYVSGSLSDLSGKIAAGYAKQSGITGDKKTIVKIFK